MPVAAIDFETTYTKDRDIKTLGVARYVEHPETEAYLVSIYREDGFTFVGHPRNTPWHEIDGCHWVSHNAAFDASVFMELKRRGIVPDELAPVEWDCTANMAAFLNCKRDLASAAKILLGVEVSKDVRDEMKGKTWETMTPEFRQQALDYALRDAELCIRLWAQYECDWPEKEKALSRHTMLMCLRGVQVDMAKVEAWLQVTRRALHALELQIPWAGTLDAKGKPVSILSPHALKRHCVANNIPPPATTADASPIFELWMEEWGPQAPFVEAVKGYRYVNRVHEILQSFVDFTSADGRLRYSLKYFGAHTGRWSGGGGINFQNFPRDPLCFDAEYRLVWDDESMGKAGKATLRAAHVVDLRNLLIASPGKKFLIGDFMQIEAVVALWFAQDWEQLALIAQGMDSYEAHARRSMGYTDTRSLKDYVHADDCPLEHRTMRQFAKCRRLGLQFGLGPVKFVMIVRQWAKLTITRAESTRIVNDFRAKEKGIVEQWNLLERALRIHIAQGIETPFEVELPSWRSLRYFNVTRAEGNTGFPVRGQPHTKLYGGFLFQNSVQATARDVLGEAILATEGVIGDVVLHVHDELVVEVDEGLPTTALEEIMEAPIAWAPDMPVKADVHESTYYRKF